MLLVPRCVGLAYLDHHGADTDRITSDGCVAGEPPFPFDEFIRFRDRLIGPEELAKAAVLDESSHAFASLPTLAKDVVRRCLHPDPEQRPSAEELLRSEWLHAMGRGRNADRVLERLGRRIHTILLRGSREGTTVHDSLNSSSSPAAAAAVAASSPPPMERSSSAAVDEVR